MGTRPGASTRSATADTAKPKVASPRTVFYVCSMGWNTSRRWFLGRFAGCFAATAFAQACSENSYSEQQIMNYEDGLAALFKSGHVNLATVALAQIGGFADRLTGWFDLAPQDVDGATMLRVFETLRTGDAAAIDKMLRSLRDRAPSFWQFVEKTSSPAWLDRALSAVGDALILTGRVDVLLELHRRTLQSLS